MKQLRKKFKKENIFILKKDLDQIDKEKFGHWEKKE